jgi:hypothetical protein
MLRVIGLSFAEIGCVKTEKHVIEFKNESDVPIALDCMVQKALDAVSEPGSPPEGFEPVIFENWRPMAVQREDGTYRASTRFGVGFLPIGFNVDMNAIGSADLIVAGDETRRVGEFILQAVRQS